MPTVGAGQAEQLRGILPKNTDFSAAAKPIQDPMVFSAHSGDAPAPSRPLWRHWLAGAVAACACGLATAEPTATPGLPALARTKERTFAIPFRIPKSDDPDADAVAQKVVLNVSTDLGISWQTAGEAAPTATSFTYRAETDGEYWFRLRAVDKKGRSRGGEGPDIRVLVDAAGPRLAGRVWKGTDGEIVCRYAAADDSLKLDSLKVEYRGPADSGWKSVAAQAILARESPAHLVGEEIWWAGDKVAAMTVRIAIADSSGNQTVKQFSLEPTDPGIDQTVLAKEIGVPPLPEQQPTADQGPSSAGVTIASLTPAVPAAGAGTWSAESAAPWSDGQPKAASVASPSAAASGRSVLVRPANTSAAGMLPQAEPRPTPQRQPLGERAARERLRQQYPVARQKIIPFRQRAMLTNEIPRRYAVAVGEYQVVGLGARRRAIARRAGAKAKVFLPYVMQWKWRARGVAFNQCARFVR